MHTKIHLQLDERRITLRRHPLRQREKFQAWDGADRYMLHHRMKHFLPPLLVVNDEFGAMALAVGDSVYLWSDSWLSKYNWQQNAKLNRQQAKDAQWRWPLDSLPQVNEVWLKVPKELALLRFQLHRLTAELAAGTPVYLAWLDKHLPKTLVSIVRQYLEGVDLLPGRFKAHGLVGFARGVVSEPSPFPTKIDVPLLHAALLAHAGVFAQYQLDIGTRFMLEHLPQGNYKRIVDLACGTGVLGLAAAQQYPQSHICFADESFMAIASAKANWDALFPGRSAEFFLGNGLMGWQGNADLILLNPPFHQNHTVDADLALALFAHARAALTDDGELWVVANQHLGHEARLRRYFQRVQVKARNAKFVLLCAAEPKFSKNTAT